MSNEQLPNNNLTQNIDEGINPPTSPSQPIAQNNKLPQPSSLKRSKSLKIILGIATFLPLFYLGVFIIVTFLIPHTYVFENDILMPPNDLIKIFLTISDMLLFNLTIFLFFIIPSPIILMINLFKNRLTSKKQKTWGIIFFLEILVPLIILLLYILSANRRGSGIDGLGLMSIALIIFLALLLFAFSLSSSIYWYRYIWKEPKQNQLS